MATKLVDTCLKASIVSLFRVHFLIDLGWGVAIFASEHSIMALFLANRWGQIIEYKDHWTENYPSTLINYPSHFS